MCLAYKPVKQLPLLTSHPYGLDRCQELKDFTGYIVLPLRGLKHFFGLCVP